MNYEKHGMYGTTEHNSWKAMKERCNRIGHPQYKDYGGRGIRVEYLSFEDFYTDVGAKPSSRHSIDRIDNDGNYTTGNCRWATSGEQRRNTNHLHLILHDGIELCAADWAEKSGIARNVLLWRIKQGWDMNKVFNKRDYRGRN
jgi:hypothetical protein